MKISRVQMKCATLILFGILMTAISQADPLPYQDPSLPAEQRIDDLISRMTLDEKLRMIGGTGFGSHANDRLGIPAIEMIDGPQGVRGVRATAFPSMFTMTATWNPKLMREVAAGIGRETRALGKNMILGPCVTLYRVPQGGRNFECFSEDPFLNSRMAESYVQGTQDAGVMSSTKHYLLNNQDQERFTIDMHIDERAFRELELPPFEAAIKAGTESIMSSYNRVDGLYASENKELLDVLSKELGFKNFIVGDWGATHDGVLAAKAGLDLEMPFGDHMGPPLKPEFESGTLPLSLLDEKIRRILRPIYQSGAMNPGFVGTPGELNSLRNRAVALRAAQEAMVLLKNDHQVLPMNPEKIRSVAVVGPNAAFRRYHANGSGEVVPFANSTVLEGLKRRLGPNVKIHYAPGVVVPGQLELIEASSVRSRTPNGKVTQGFHAEFWDNSDMKGAPLITRTEPDIQLGNTMAADPKLEIGKYSARWTGQLDVPVSGPVEFDLGVTGRAYRFYVDGKLITDLYYKNDGWEQKVRLDHLDAGPHEIKLEYRNTVDHFKLRLSWAPPRADFKEAIEAAKHADYAVVVVGTSDSFEGEEMDRKTIHLPGEQEKLIHAVNEVNPKTVVVVNSGGPVSMRSWRDRTPAIVQAFFPGQEGGLATADILTGRVNPSGKLPLTLPRAIEDSPSHAYYPGVGGKIDYSRVGIFEGYRGYEKKGTAPEFAFGHGLSYTSFEYSAPEVKLLSNRADAPKVRVSLSLRNSGAVRGAETVQLYVGQTSPSLPRPIKELKAFQKIALNPGRERKITFDLDSTAFRYWDPATHSWKIDPGQFQIHVGASSSDIRHSSAITLHSAELPAGVCGKRFRAVIPK